MNRPSQVLVLVTLATALTACSRAPVGVSSIVQASPEPMASASAVAPTASPIGTPSPTAQAEDPATVLAANGIGPYVVGAWLSELKSDGLVTNVEPSFHCDDEWQSAEATGRYADQLTVTFHLGRLIDLHTASAALVTPAGARVGMPVTELQGIYGSQGNLVTGTSGNQAVSVHEPDSELGIVFYLDEANSTIRSMSAGGVERLEAMAVVGEGC